MTCNYPTSRSSDLERCIADPNRKVLSLIEVRATVYAIL